MHVFYCKKCKKDSLTPICEHCGQPITALSSNERFKWRAIRVPLGDARSIWGALKVLALAEILLILFCFIGELLVAQDKQMALTMLTGSGMLPWALVFFGLGAVIICFAWACRDGKKCTTCWIKAARICKSGSNRDGFAATPVFCPTKAITSPRITRATRACS